MKLAHRVALVTGSGSGIGREIALLFAKEGATVIVNDINVEAARGTVQDVESGTGRACAIQADVADSAQVKAMFAETDARFGALHILVNNAGIAASARKWEEINQKAEARLDELSSQGTVRTHWDVTQDLSDDEWHRMLAVHLDGTFFCTREALKIMSRQNSGVIINMSSVAALKGLDVSPHYATAKGGILAFTRSLAQEVVSRNIRVNAICPGFIDTSFNDPISPRLKSFFLSQIPMGRSATPREVATTALFLASDASSYYTGQWLSPNGGIFIA
jgi:3-oxoacyl-[acyl-carrier protein] reductase